MPIKEASITREEAIKKLVSIQNQPKNWNVDILTITGFMTDDEVIQHLNRNK